MKGSPVFKVVRLVLLLLLSAMLQLASLPATAAGAEFQKIKIAVLDFQQNGAFSTQDVGKIVAEWFTTSLVETGRFEVIERRLLQQILQEQKMGASGLLDPNSASRLGKVLGVKTIVTGTVQSYDRTYELNVRLINVETGAIITADRVRAATTSSLPELVSQVSARIIRHFPLEGYVVQRSANSVLVDLGRLAGVKPGMQFNVFVEGAPVRHPKTGEVLSIERVQKGVITVSEVREKTAVADIALESCQSCIAAGQLISSIQEVVEPLQGKAGLLSKEEQRRLEEAERKEYERLEKEAKAREKEFEKERKKAEEREREQAKNQVNAKTIKAQDLQGMQALFAIGGAKEEWRSIAVSPSGGMIALGDKGGAISVWDLGKGNQLYSLPGHLKGEVLALDFSNDGRLLASASEKKVIIWDLAKQQQVSAVEVSDTVTDLEFSRSGRLLAIGTTSREAFLWDFKAGRLRPVRHGDDVMAVAVSPDSRLVATAGKGRRIALWDAISGKQLRLFAGHEKDVRGLAFVAGGRQLLSVADDKLVLLWDVNSATVQKAMRGHDDNVVYMAVSKDGKRAISAEKRRSGGLLIFWDLAAGQELKRIKSDRRIDLLAMSPDGKLLMLANGKELAVYKLD